MLDFGESKGMKMNARPIKFGHKYYDEKARALALSVNQFVGPVGKLRELEKFVG